MLHIYYLSYQYILIVYINQFRTMRGANYVFFFSRILNQMHDFLLRSLKLKVVSGIKLDKLVHSRSSILKFFLMK